MGWGGQRKNLSDYLYGWLWRYSHIPHGLNVNECMTKLGDVAGNKSKVSRKRLVSPRPVKCLKIDNSDEPLKNPEPCLRQVATTAQSASAAKRKVTLMPKEIQKDASVNSFVTALGLNAQV